MPPLLTEKQLVYKIKPITKADAIQSLEDTFFSYINADDTNGDTTTTTQKTTGNQFLYYFFFPEIIKTKSGNKNMSFIEFYNNAKEIYKDKPYLKRMVAYELEKQHGNREKALYRTFSLYMGSINLFKPFHAIEIYHKYRPTHILDPCAGFGGRAMGACVVGVPYYTGIDINTHLRAPYDKMTAILGEYSNTKIRMIYKNALEVDYGAITPRYDMVMTSPPYYDIEQYRQMETHQTKQEWNEHFYLPLFEKTYRGLSKGGYFIMNVPVEIYESVLYPFLGTPTEKIPLKKQKRNPNTAYEEFMYVWRK